MKPISTKRSPTSSSDWLGSGDVLAGMNGGPDSSWGRSKWKHAVADSPSQQMPPCSSNGGEMLTQSFNNPMQISYRTLLALSDPAITSNMTNLAPLLLAQMGGHGSGSQMMPPASPNQNQLTQLVARERSSQMMPSASPNPNQLTQLISRERSRQMMPPAFPNQNQLAQLVAHERSSQMVPHAPPNQNQLAQPVARESGQMMPSASPNPNQLTQHTQLIAHERSRQMMPPASPNQNQLAQLVAHESSSQMMPPAYPNQNQLAQLVARERSSQMMPPAPPNPNQLAQLIAPERSRQMMPPASPNQNQLAVCESSSQVMPSAFSFFLNGNSIPTSSNSSSNSWPPQQLTPKAQCGFPVPLLPDLNSLPETHMINTAVSKPVDSPETPANLGKNMRSQDFRGVEIIDLVDNTASSQNNHHNRFCQQTAVQEALLSFSGPGVALQQQEGEMNVTPPAEISLKQAEGENPGIDLNKTPEPNPKRKKHKPKVIGEGKAAKTPKPVTPKPVTPQRAKKTENPPHAKRAPRETNPLQEYVSVPQTPNPPPQPSRQEMMRANRIQDEYIRMLNSITSPPQTARREGENMKKLARMNSHLNTAGNHVISSEPGQNQSASDNKIYAALLKGTKRNRSLVDDAQISGHPSHMHAYNGINMGSENCGMSRNGLCSPEICKRLRTENMQNEGTPNAYSTFTCNPGSTKTVQAAQSTSKAFTFADAQRFMVYEKLRAFERMLACNQAENTAHNRPSQSPSRPLKTVVDYQRAATPVKPSGHNNAGSYQPSTPEKPPEFTSSHDIMSIGPQARIEALIASSELKQKARGRKKKEQVPANPMSSKSKQSENEAASSTTEFSHGQETLSTSSPTKNTNINNSHLRISFVEGNRGTSRPRGPVSRNSQLGTVVPYMDPIDELVRRLSCLNINEGNKKVTVQEQNALVPCAGGLGAIVVFEGKKRKPRPKVDLDPELDRVWRLLMGREVEGDAEMGADKEKWWEEERRVFRGRAESFIAHMHLVQGDRCFSKWKGLVVDSVVGVFLTRNVSDHLSSSAFMPLVAKFPARSSGINNMTNLENISRPVASNDALSGEGRMSEQQSCDPSSVVIHEVASADGKDMTSNNESPESNTGSSSSDCLGIDNVNSHELELGIGHESPDSGSATAVTVTSTSGIGEDRSSMEDVVPSQKSVASQNISKYLAQTADQGKLNSLLNFDSDLPSGGMSNGFNSFTELLKMENSSGLQETGQNQSALDRFCDSLLKGTKRKRSPQISGHPSHMHAYNGLNRGSSENCGTSRNGLCSPDIYRRPRTENMQNEGTSTAHSTFTCNSGSPKTVQAAQNTSKSFTFADAERFMFDKQLRSIQCILASKRAENTANNRPSQAPLEGTERNHSLVGDAQISGHPGQMHAYNGTNRGSDSCDTRRNGLYSHEIYKRRGTENMQNEGTSTAYCTFTCNPGSPKTVQAAQNTSKAFTFPDAQRFMAYEKLPAFQRKFACHQAENTAKVKTESMLAYNGGSESCGTSRNGLCSPEIYKRPRTENMQNEGTSNAYSTFTCNSGSPETVNPAQNTSKALAYADAQRFEACKKLRAFQRMLACNRPSQPPIRPLKAVVDCQRAAAPVKPSGQNNAGSYQPSTPEMSPDSGSATAVTVTGSTSGIEGEDRSSMEDVVSSQNCVASQNFSKYHVQTTDQRKVNSLLNFDSDLLSGGMGNGFNSFTELLNVANSRGLQELNGPGNGRTLSTEHSPGDQSVQKSRYWLDTRMKLSKKSRSRR